MEGLDDETKAILEKAIAEAIAEAKKRDPRVAGVAGTVVTIAGEETCSDVFAVNVSGMPVDHVAVAAIAARDLTEYVAIQIAEARLAAAGPSGGN